MNHEHDCEQMSRLLEEIDYRSTPLGALSLRRRHELTLGVDVFEIKLGEELFMSSLFTASEIALARLGLAALHGEDLEVVVGGLGLGLTPRTLAIIAETQKQAAILHRRLTTADVKARLLDADSSGFSTGVLVCTAHLPKGLEFDRVIVADVGAENYRTELDRNLLYVACTRAMDRLTVIAAGALSELLPPPLAA